jgi:sulfur carrier protein
VKIRLNGEESDAPEGVTVAVLVERTVADPQARGIAVALDDEVTSRSAWSSTVVTVGQRVEILQASQGG